MQEKAKLDELLQDALDIVGMKDMFHLIEKDGGYYITAMLEIDPDNPIKSILWLKDDLVKRFCRSVVFYDLCEKHRMEIAKLKRD